MGSQLRLFDKNAPAPKRRSFHVQGGAPTVEEAIAGEARARGQEMRVLAFLRLHPGARFTPPEIADELGIPRDNSVARSLSDLKRDGLVRKHMDDRREGRWGVPNCTWSAL